MFKRLNRLPLALALGLLAALLGVAGASVVAGAQSYTVNTVTQIGVLGGNIVFDTADGNQVFYIPQPPQDVDHVANFNVTPATWTEVVDAIKYRNGDPNWQTASEATATKWLALNFGDGGNDQIVIAQSAINSLTGVPDATTVQSWLLDPLAQGNATKGLPGQAQPNGPVVASTTTPAPASVQTVVPAPVTTSAQATTPAPVPPTPAEIVAADPAVHLPIQTSVPMTTPSATTPPKPIPAPATTVTVARQGAALVVETPTVQSPRPVDIPTRAAVPTRQVAPATQRVVGTHGMILRRVPWVRYAPILVALVLLVLIFRLIRRSASLARG